MACTSCAPGKSDANNNPARRRALWIALPVNGAMFVAEMVERLLTRGPARTMIADLDEGTISGGTRTIRIDEDLVGKLTFIKEGEFDEKAGAPDAAPGR
jgi:hypothetical protein